MFDPSAIKSTKDIAMDGVKLLVYGESGVGKTRLIQTLPSPLIISTENGLLSLKSWNIPYIQVKGRSETDPASQSALDSLVDCYKWLQSSDARARFKSVALDSITDIAEVILSEKKKGNKDLRAAYGAMMDEVGVIIRLFRDLRGWHVYFSAQLEKDKAVDESLNFMPSMPGNKTTQSLPYFFDEVLALQYAGLKGVSTERRLRCQPDLGWIIKDRSGRLNDVEPANLGAVIAKIEGKTTEAKV